VVNIEFLSPSNLPADKDGLTSAYHAVYSAPPYNEPFAAARKFGTDIIEHSQRQGFHCVIARLIPDNQIIGFAYGFSCLSGTWWHDTVTQGLSRDIVEKWFSNAFEFVEFGVVPAFQGQGIGSRIHQKLFSNLEYRTAVLNVLQADIPAFHLYQARGWTTIRRDFFYNPEGSPCAILGLDIEAYNSDSKAAGE
jgi:ribosomal protein S18 acetylase RimI-like enzyme